MLTSIWFWWSNSSLQLIVWNGCVWMWWIILWAMLCIISWSQRLVMVKNLCEVTITKRLAWLVEQLVVSSHEFSFIVPPFFLYFNNRFQNSFFIFSSLFSPSSLFTFVFIFFTSSFIFFSILFFKPLLFYFHIVVLSPSSPITSRFLFSFFYSLF